MKNSTSRLMKIVRRARMDGWLECDGQQCSNMIRSKEPLVMPTNKEEDDETIGGWRWKQDTREGDDNDNDDDGNRRQRRMA